MWSLSDRRILIIFFILVAVIFAKLIFNQYWRLQLMFNSSALSLYTPDIFPVSEEYRDSHDKTTKLGFQVASTKTIVICSLLRNVADRFPEIKKRAEKMGEMFGDYRIVIAENDSTDGTRKLLNDWRRQNPKVIILGCGVNSAEDTCHIDIASQPTIGHPVNRKRIEKMTYLRNLCLDYVKNKLYNYDYLAVWDLDVIGVVYLDGVANTIGHFHTPSSPAYKADGICAYGIYRWGYLKIYYDTYAHHDFDPDYDEGHELITHVKKGLKLNRDRGTPPIHVKSCFGGFTIYRIESLLSDKVIYDMSPPEINVECEHARLHGKLKRMYYNPSMIHQLVLNP